MRIELEEVYKLADPFVVFEGEGLLLEPTDNGDEAHQEVVRSIRGAECRTKQALFDEVAAALQFPDYFGGNWDAFEECINDLNWLPANRYVIEITHADELLLDEKNTDLQILLDILQEAAKNWKSGANSARLLRTLNQEGEPKDIDFAVLFQCTENANPMGNFRSLLKEADIPKI